MKSLIIYFSDTHHLFPITAPTNARLIWDSSRFPKSRISSKDVLNFQLPARLGLLAHRTLTLTSLWSAFPIKWNMGQLTKSQSALLTLCPSRSLLGQWASYLATSTSPVPGWSRRNLSIKSHLPNLLTPRPTLSILEWRIVFKSPTKTSHFVEEWCQPSKKKSPLTSDIRRINRAHPEPAKTAFTSASRLRPTCKETPALLQLSYVEKTALDSLQRKWNESLALQWHLHWG